jgi:hypothetical protein
MRMTRAVSDWVEHTDGDGGGNAERDGRYALIVCLGRHWPQFPSALPRVTFLTVCRLQRMVEQA